MKPNSKKVTNFFAEWPGGVFFFASFRSGGEKLLWFFFVETFREDVTITTAVMMLPS